MGPRQKTKGTETQLLSETVTEKPVKPALGSPHDGYAAVLLTVAVGLFYFGLGFGRLITDSQEHLWWIPLALVPVGVVLVVLPLKYFFRAHGIRERGGGFPALPALAMYAAFAALIMFVIPALAGSADSWWAFGLTCLALSTLTMAPVQLILSKDPNRDSELTA